MGYLEKYESWNLGLLWQMSYFTLNFGRIHPLVIYSVNSQPPESQGIQGRLGQIRDCPYKAWEAIYISVEFWYLYNGLGLSDGACTISRSGIIAAGMIDPDVTHCMQKAIVWDILEYFLVWLKLLHCFVWLFHCWRKGRNWEALTKCETSLSCSFRTCTCCGGHLDILYIPQFIWSS